MAYLRQASHYYPVPVGHECPVSVLQYQRLSKRQRFFVSLLLLSPGHNAQPVLLSQARGPRHLAPWCGCGWH
jgi:hypothetical protein